MLTKDLMEKGDHINVLDSDNQNLKIKVNELEKSILANKVVGNIVETPKSKEKAQTCEKCDFISKNKAGLDKLIRSKHREPENTHKCDNCDYEGKTTYK